jgi:hypothetical protein
MTIPTVSGSLFRRSFTVAALSGLLSVGLFGQADQNANAGNADANNARQQRRANRQAGNADAANNNGNNNGGRGNFDPAQMQERMMTMMREQFGVTDDAEWKLISDRITAVSELRRGAGGGLGGGFAAFRGAQAQGQQGGGRRGNFGASPEQDALRQAITDKLPDAEVKSRLDRLREARKANEEKLAKAQEELRAVLTPRQEAVAVMAGLLP